MTNEHNNVPTLRLGDYFVLVDGDDPPPNNFEEARKQAQDVIESGYPRAYILMVVEVVK